METRKTIYKLRALAHKLSCEIKFLELLAKLEDKAPDLKELEDFQKQYSEGYLSTSDYIELLARISSCSADDFAEILLAYVKWKEL